MLQGVISSAIFCRQSRGGKSSFTVMSFNNYVKKRGTYSTPPYPMKNGTKLLIL